MRKREKRDSSRKERALAQSASTAGAEEEESAAFIPDDRLPEFVAAVKRGIASAERGDFVEHEEVLARIERLLHS